MSKKKARAKRHDDKIKGNLVEQIVAQMHHVRGVKVEPNARLKSKRNPKRRREIDVLLTAKVAGYEVRIAFECKNYKRVPDVVKIGEFADKLDDVGIARENSIFVSPKGFTVGALDRAQQLGMKTLLLSGLTEDRLSSLVIEAFQSVVYLLPIVTSWEVTNELPDVKAEEIWFWFDEEGRQVAQMPDLIWHRWQDGEPPSIIGVHEVTVDAPGWSHKVDGKRVVPASVRFTVQVYGLVITMGGRAQDHSLIDALSKQLEKRQVKVQFDEPAEDTPLRLFDTESAFRESVNERPESMKVVHRVRLPRLLWNGLFWPLSERVYLKLVDLAKKKNPDDITTASDFAAIEGPSIGSVWEPPATISPKPASR